MAKTTQYRLELKDEVSAQLRNIEGKLATTNQKMGEMQKAGDAAFGVAKLGAYGAAAVISLGLVKDMTGQAVKAYGDFEEKQLRLQAQLKVSGNQLGLTAQQVMGLASALEGVTGIDDGDILNAISTLQTFQNVTGDTFKGAVEQAANLSVVFGDIDTAAKQLGAALENPAENLDKLKKASVFFTDAEKAQIEAMQEAGDVASAQAAVLDKVREKYDGLAESVNTGVNGSIRNLANAWDDSMKNFGAAVTQWAQPVIDSLTEKLNALNASVTISGKTSAQEGYLSKLSSISRASVQNPEDKKKADKAAEDLGAKLFATGFSFESQIGAFETKAAEIQKVITNVTKAGADSATIQSWKDQLAVYDKEIERLTEIRSLLDTIRSKPATKPQGPGPSGDTTPRIGVSAGGYFDLSEQITPTMAMGPQPGPTSQDELDALALAAGLLADKTSELGSVAKMAVYNFEDLEDPVQRAANAMITGLEKAKPMVDNLGKAWAQVSTIFANYAQIQEQNAQANLDRMARELDLYTAGQDAKIAQAKAAGEDTAQLEVDKANEVYSKKQEIAEAEAKMKRKAWAAQRQASITEALMSGAVAGLDALKLLPNVPLALGMGALAAAVTASNVALISSQAMPAFARGGIVPGNLFSGDRVMARLDSGEMVLNRPQQGRLWSMLTGGGGGGGGVRINIERVYGTVDQDFLDALDRDQDLRDYRGVRR